MDPINRSTRSGRRAWTIAVVGALIVMGGSALALGGDGGIRTAPSCGLASPDPALGDDVLPALAEFPGAERVAIAHGNGFLSADLNVPLSVRELFEVLRSRVRGSAYEILRQDFEGFEAELYIARNGQAGVLQILRSTCPDRSRLLIQLPSNES